MGRILKQFSSITGHILDVPQDVTMHLPRVTMIGNMQMYIENHRGVLHFSSEMLKLALPKGTIEVHGANLIIRTIQKEEVFIEGLIDDVKYQNLNE